MTQQNWGAPSEPPPFAPPQGPPVYSGYGPYGGTQTSGVDPINFATPTPPGWYAPQPPPKRRRWRHLLLVLISGIIGLALGTQVSGIARPAQNLPVETPERPRVPTTEPLVPTPGQSESETTAIMSRGVVLITAQGPQSSGAGTGMILTEDGLVLTNYHVVEGSTSLTVTAPNESKVFRATVLGRDASNDVALLQLENASGLETVSVNQREVKVGDPVTAIGNARGQGYLSIASGKIASLSETITVQDDFGGTRRLEGVIATTAAAVPGDSGGPMLDANGQVIGMTSAGSTVSNQGVEQTTVSFAVPIRRALSVVDQITTGNTSGTVQIGPKAYLGITATGESGGVLVNSVERGRPAAEAGLKKGDTIVSLDGEATTDRTVLADVLAGLKPDTTVEIKWITSSGQPTSAMITLAASPVN